MKKPRLQAIEFIRGISMLGVVAIHVGSQHLLAVGGANMHMIALLEIASRFSVPIFFFISDSLKNVRVIFKIFNKFGCKSGSPPKIWISFTNPLLISAILFTSFLYSLIEMQLLSARGEK